VSQKKKATQSRFKEEPSVGQLFNQPFNQNFTLRVAKFTSDTSEIVKSLRNQQDAHLKSVSYYPPEHQAQKKVPSQIQQLR